MNSKLQVVIEDFEERQHPMYEDNALNPAMQFAKCLLAVVI